MSASTKHETTTLDLDVYGLKDAVLARRILAGLVEIGVLPTILFSVDWRCKKVVAVEAGEKPRLVYATVGGPRCGITQWSTRPEVFSSRLKRDASLALGRHLSGDIKHPLRIRYTVGVA